MPIHWKGTLDDLLPADHLARFIWNVLAAIDFTELESSYRAVDGGPGRPPYHPRILAALWIYGLTQGLETAAGIAMACQLRDDFRWLAGRHCPSDQTLLNFLKVAEIKLAPIWSQVLKAMQDRGLIDLSVVIEDGTKMRANASPRSFQSAAQIEKKIGELEPLLAGKLEILASPEKGILDRKAIAEITGLRLRLQRAQKAQQELRERAERRDARTSAARDETRDGAAEPLRTVRPRADKFGRSDFRIDGDKLVCPGGEELRFIGQYSGEGGRGAYKLFGKADCAGCPIIEQCTDGKGRRVKISLAEEANHMTGNERGRASEAQPNTTSAPTTKEEKPEPQASVTEPEALMMLATSQKRWEPSYNADLTVTRDGIIISQFLTKDANDFGHFKKALPAVTSLLGIPASWLGDGHYGSRANLQIADAAKVVLYAPGPTKPDKANAKEEPDAALRPTSDADDEEVAACETRKSKVFGADEFDHDPERNSLICPEGQELRFIGRYATDNGIGTYVLYGRKDCGGCPSKTKCTNGQGRRVKKIETGRRRFARTEEEGVEDARIEALVKERDERMEAKGKEMMKLRGTTVEPTNAHIRQHGLKRFHVHGMHRCRNILTLGCLAHNLLKWRTMEVTRAALAAA